MRFLAVAVLGMTLLAVPAMAAMPASQGGGAAGNNGTAGHVFGKAFCSTSVACPESSANTSSADYAVAGNACMHEQFGYASITEFFNDHYGLDRNGCLTTNSHALASTTAPGSAELSPQCCVVHKTDDVCIFRCMLVSM